MAIERRRVVYEGRVQGVGFRMTARRISSAFAVSGFVRNLADGSVEVIAEGDPGMVASFLEAIRREFGDMIRDVRETQEPTGEARPFGFSIAF